MSQVDVPSDEVVTAADGARPARSPSRAPDDPFRLKIGRFTVLQVVGSGGMGKVYAAYDPQLDRQVAVKLVHRGVDGGTEGRARLQREALALAKVSHPHVVAIHDVGEHLGEVFMAMEFVTGVNLRQWLRQRPRTWREVLAHFVQAGEGLQAVHAAGLVHRDFKPDNVLVGEDGRVRLADFGLVGMSEGSRALSGGEEEEEDERLTIPGTLMGTPAYMSPEQHRRETVTTASDIYSFCIALYEGLYGERPFRAAKMAGLVEAKVAGQIRPPPAGSQVPAWLRAVLVRGLAPAPRNRWPSMAALLAALADDPDERRRARLRFAGWLALAALGGLVVFLAIGAGLAAWRRAEAEALAAAHLAATSRQIAAFAEAGDEAGAAAAFAAFVSAEEHRGTRALARAWLEEAARLRRRGDLAAARAAYASAYSSAIDPEGEFTALLALADMLHETWSIDHLEVVLATLERLPASPAAEADLLRWRIETLIAQRDLGAASARLAALGPEAPAELQAWRPVVQSLGAATATEHAGALVFDLDDGRVALTTGTTLTITRATPSLPVLATIPLPERLAGPPWVFASRRHGEIWVLGWRDVRAERVELVLYDLVDGRLREQMRWEDSVPLGATAIDGSEGPRLYVGIGAFARHTIEIRRSAGGLMRSSAHPGTDATVSDIAAVAAADLDGDGRDELAIAAGPWRAYDVRVLRRSAQDTGFELVARDKLGYVGALAPLRRADGVTLLAAAKLDSYQNPLLFPDGQHYGAPAGIHLLALAGDALRPQGRLPLRNGADGPAWSVSSLRAGDVDGDGLEDLVAQIGDPGDRSPGLVIDRQLDAGTFARVRLRGVVPRALLDLDDDPQRELVVEVEGRLWVLGAGEAALPRLTTRQPATLEVQPHADPILVQTQRRAEQLVAMGLGREAAELLERGADLAPEPARKAAMLRRAADLYAATGAANEAGRAYDHLARTADPVAGLWGAATLHHEGGRMHEALARVELLLARDDVPAELRAEATALQRSLAPLAHPQEVLAWTFDRPLADEWQVADPIGVRRDPLRGTLRIDAFTDGVPLATFPVRWDGGPLSLSVDLTIERLEWGGGLTIGLRPVGAPGPMLPIAVGVEGVGGQATLSHRIHFFLPDRARPLGIADIPVASASTPLRGILRLDLHEGRAITTWTPSSGPPRRAVHPVGKALEGGPYELVIAPATSRAEANPWARVVMRRIEVGHAHARETATKRVPRATRLHAEGDLAAALAAYPRTARAAPQIHAWRSAALFDIGEPNAAAAAVELALAGDDAARATLAHLLRLRPQLYGPLLRSLDPERFAAMLFNVWRAPIVMNPDAVTLQGLDVLLSQDVPKDMSMSSATAMARLWLQAQRGRAWALRGEHERARRDMTSALAAAKWVEPGPGEQAEFDTAVTEAHLELAAMAMRDGSLEQAREHVSAALEHARAPELVVDKLSVHPALVDLKDDPDWRALFGR